MYQRPIIIKLLEKNAALISACCESGAVATKQCDTVRENAFIWRVRWHGIPN